MLLAGPRRDGYRTTDSLTRGPDGLHHRAVTSPQHSGGPAETVSIVSVPGRAPAVNHKNQKGCFQRLPAAADRREEDRSRQRATDDHSHLILLRCCHKEDSPTDPLTSTLPIAGRYLVAMGRSAFTAKLPLNAPGVNVSSGPISDLSTVSLTSCRRSEVQKFRVTQGLDLST
jgi:hypothetical protein